MKDLEIELLDRAIDSLTKVADVKINIESYIPNNQEADATGFLTFEGINASLPIQLKLTSSFSLFINKIHQLNNQTIIVANYINPTVAERLKEQGIWFIDTVGNAYINQNPFFIYIRGNKAPENPTTRSISRAFQITGLKVVYAFLCNPKLVNAPYREIAQTAGVALGTVGWVMTDLTQLSFIIDMGDRGRRLKNRRKLLERWITNYAERLRPKLEKGRYKAQKPDWWQTAEIQKLPAYWGGEVAADMLTHYLKPKTITIYASEKQGVMLRITNKLRKDPDGDIEILNTFWDTEKITNHIPIVDPILIYADLMTSGDPRNIETAQILYDQELAEHFRED